MKVAVYACTRNQYADVLPSIKSLLINSDVEKIYILTEDDVFPYELPDECECVNVDNSGYIRVNSVNNGKHYARMVMTRAALYKLFPDLDRVLVLDTDTIVTGNISDLWDVDLDEYYLAAVPEVGRDGYVNIGVALYNLDKLRDGTGDAVLNELNWKRCVFYEQDAFNRVCAGKIRELPSCYNSCDFTEPCVNTKIIHYAGIRDWMHMPPVEEYRAIPFSEIRNSVLVEPEKPRKRRKN